MQPKYYGAAAQPYAKASGGGGFGGKKLLLIAGLVIFVITILIASVTLVSSVTKGPQDEFVTLVARTSNLQTLLDKQSANIKNGDLKKINAEANTLLISDSVGLTAQATTLYGVTEIPEAIASAEATTTTEEALEKAKVSGTFDRTYVTEITDKLNATFDLAQKMKQASGSPETTQVLDAMLTNLVTINDQLSKVQL